MDHLSSNSDCSTFIHLDSIKWIQKGEKRNSLFIYNENFQDYASGITSGGGGNGDLKKIRDDIENPLLEKDKIVKNDTNHVLSIPTFGVEPTDEVIEKFRTLNWEYEGNFTIMNNSIKCTEYIELIKIAFTNIYKYVLEHEEIEHIYYNTTNMNGTNNFDFEAEIETLTKFNGKLNDKAKENKKFELGMSIFYKTNINTMPHYSNALKELFYSLNEEIPTIYDFHEEY